MGQFKPMVKMMTTEPTVELKLKKGGHVKNPKMKAEDNGTGYKKMADGGTMGMLASTPALVGRPAVNAPVRAPGKPSMAARRKAMRPSPLAARTMAPPMKKGGEAHEDEAQDRAMIKKAMAGKKFATGGVVMGQGGYKTGGVAKGNAGGYAKGGGIEGNVSGTPAGVTNTKTGGVKLGNAGGFRKGGAAKKFADGGAVQDDGRAVKMPQGNKRPSTPVSINQLSGTFKKGGSVTPAQKKEQSAFKAENTTAMKQAKAQSNLKYQSGGGVTDASKGAYDKSIGPSESDMDMAKAIRSVPRKLYEGAKSLFTSKDKPAGSVTKTEKSVTVSPAKKRGGSVKC